MLIDTWELSLILLCAFQPSQAITFGVPRENASSCLCDDAVTYEDCVTTAPSECHQVVLGLGYTYVQYFCGYDEICTSKASSYEAYEMALKNLNEYDIIGITEDLDGFIRDTVDVMQISEVTVSLTAPRVKITSFGQNISASAVARILEYNAQSTELALYKEILKRLAYRRSACGLLKELGQSLRITSENIDALTGNWPHCLSRTRVDSR